MFSRMGKAKSARIEDSWAELRGWVVESLQLDPKWYIEQPEMLQWWSGPFPTTLKVAGRYILDDGVARVYIDVYTEIGTLGEDSATMELLEKINEWNITYSTSRAHLGGDGIIGLHAALSYSSVFNANRGFILSAVLHQANKACELANLVSSVKGVNLLEVPHPTAGIRCDQDELATMQLDAAPNKFPDDRFESEQVRQQYKLLLAPWADAEPSESSWPAFSLKDSGALLVGDPIIGDRNLGDGFLFAVDLDLAGKAEDKAITLILLRMAEEAARDVVIAGLHYTPSLGALCLVSDGAGNHLCVLRLFVPAIALLHMSPGPLDNARAAEAIATCAKIAVAESRHKRSLLLAAINQASNRFD